MRPVEAVLIVAVAVLGIAIGLRIRALVASARRSADVHALLQTFGPAQAAVLNDPRQLVAWYPLAEAARKLFPAAFGALDEATGTRFPFSKEIVERAHARVSSDWLAWEKAHDEEYRLKAAAAEEAMTRASGQEAVVARARLERIQHEKIERYQQRYEEYVRDSRGLQALIQ